MEDIILKALDRIKLSKRGLPLDEADILKSIRDMEVLIKMDILYIEPLYQVHILEKTLGIECREDGLLQLEILKNKLIEKLNNGELL